MPQPLDNVGSSYDAGIEAENDWQGIVAKSIRKWAEFGCSGLDCTLRFQIEGVGAGPCDERDSNDRAVAANDESNLCAPTGGRIGRIESKGNLADDVVEVPWERKSDSFGLYRSDISPLPPDGSAASFWRGRGRSSSCRFFDRSGSRCSLLRSDLRDWDCRLFRRSGSGRSDSLRRHGLIRSLRLHSADRTWTRRRGNDVHLVDGRQRFLLTFAKAENH